MKESLPLFGDGPEALLSLGIGSEYFSQFHCHLGISTMNQPMN
jgi:hypothetical protein